MRLLLTLLFLVILFSAKANLQVNFSIKFPQNIKISKVQLMYDDGLTQNFISAEFENNVTNLNMDLPNPYATLTILYPGSDDRMYGVRLIISDKKSYIKFRQVPDSVQNQLLQYTLKNAVDVSKAKEYAVLKEFTLNEFEKNEANRLRYQLNDNDSNVANYNQTSKDLAIKELSFIRQHGQLYFYFWYFRQNIVRTLLKTHQLQLYEVFNTAFPERFKETYEGKNLKALLEGNIYLKKGYMSPDFNLKDYKGNPASLASVKGKYVLLSFWATWCKPCIEEIPLLKVIRDKYNFEKLEIVSVSFDDDSTAFTKGISKYEMNWRHVFGKNNIRNLFGDKPIPSLYLIGPDGILLFSSWEDSLEELKSILNKELEEQ